MGAWDGARSPFIPDSYLAPAVPSGLQFAWPQARGDDPMFLKSAEARVHCLWMGHFVNYVLRMSFQASL